MTIDNQCSNIKLISPVYFTKNAMYHIRFPQQVDHDCIMKANFITDINQNTFGGALLYRLQHEEDVEIHVTSGKSPIRLQLHMSHRHKYGSHPTHNKETTKPFSFLTTHVFTAVSPNRCIELNR
jgi:hypothetical protein